MVDFEHDKIFPLNQAKIPGNPSVPTRWRWANRGIKGIRLETFIVGGRPFVTLAAIEEFIARVTTARYGESAPLLRSPSKRLRDIERAERELAEAGI